MHSDIVLQQRPKFYDLNRLCQCHVYRIPYTDISIFRCIVLHSCMLYHMSDFGERDIIIIL